MTLLVTIAAPDVLVMSADSALTYRAGSETVTLTGFPKICYVPTRHLGISYTGPAKIADSWIHSWLARYCDEIGTEPNPQEFCNNLAKTLNETAGANDEVLALQVGTWAKLEGTSTLVPCVFEISNPERNGFRTTYMISQELLQATRQFPNGQYLCQILSAGVPAQYAPWVNKMLPEYSSLIGTQVPKPNAESLLNLARFLIRQICDLLIIAGSPNVVATPILTRVLLPKPVYMVSDYR